MICFAVTTSGNARIKQKITPILLKMVYIWINSIVQIYMEIKVMHQDSISLSVYFLKSDS